jgi:hypothetical protein
LGRVRYRLQYRYTIRTRISTIITIGPSLTGLMGTQLTGSISYTLVNSFILFNCCIVLALKYLYNDHVLPALHLFIGHKNNLIQLFFMSQVHMTLGRFAGPRSKVFSSHSAQILGGYSRHQSKSAMERPSSMADRSAMERPPSMAAQIYHDRLP